MLCLLVGKELVMNLYSGKARSAKFHLLFFPHRITERRESRWRVLSRVARQHSQTIKTLGNSGKARSAKFNLLFFLIETLGKREALNLIYFFPHRNSGKLWESAKR